MAMKQQQNIYNPRQFNQLVIDRSSTREWKREEEREKKIEEKQINKIKKIPLAFLPIFLLLCAAYFSSNYLFYCKMLKWIMMMMMMIVECQFDEKFLSCHLKKKYWKSSVDEEWEREEKSQ